jgi:sigma-B regulation protein RsbU (phosphoserine phosphatase)
LASFFVALGTGEEKILSSEKSVLAIGRLVDSEIFIDEPVVSRRHAEVFRSGDTYFIRDVGSRNGTFLNGKRVFQPAELAPGSVISVGASKIVFEPTETLVLLKDQAIEKPSSTVSLAKPPSSSQVMAPLVLLETVAEIARQLVQSMPLESLLDSIVRVCVEKTAAERAAIMLVGKDEILMPRAYFSRSKTGGKFAISQSIARKAIRENQAILIKDVAGDENLRMSESIASLRIRSAICTPLWNGEKTVGVLYVDTTELDRQFGEIDLLFFSSLSGMIAEKIENALLGEIAKEKDRLDTEIAIAKEIQHNLFPREIPRIEGYDVSCYNRPSREVGGDYFDVITAGAFFGIAIADVSGKGIGAAMLMSNLQAILRSKAGVVDGAGEVLRQMNVDLLERVGSGRFITAVYLVLDPVACKLAYANAGHNPPLVVTAGGEISALEVSGIPLGILAGTEYPAFEQMVSPGDVVVLYSDGVTECIAMDGAFFGEERLKQILGDHHTRPAAEIAEAIVLAVDAFREDEPISDDMTLVVIKRTAQCPPTDRPA